MTKSTALFLAIALVAVPVAAEPGEKPRPKKEPKATPAPVRSVSPPLTKVILPPARGPRYAAAVTGKLVMIEKVRAKVRLTNRWCFVVDNSDSMKGVFGLAMSGYRQLTRFPNDDLRFCVFSFGNLSQEKYLPWQWASPVAFKKASDWLHKNRGTYSHGLRAISKALQLKEDKLTIFLVTDGGFTSACTTPPNFGPLVRTIRAGQAWRKKKGLGRAIIVTIGIANPGYRLANKPSDRVCQAWLRRIGRTHGGGYHLIRKVVTKAAGATRKKKAPSSRRAPRVPPWGRGPW
jgi:hypothetical protein